MTVRWLHSAEFGGRASLNAHVAEEFWPKQMKYQAPGVHGKYTTHTIEFKSLEELTQQDRVLICDGIATGPTYESISLLELELSDLRGYVFKITVL